MTKPDDPEVRALIGELLAAAPVAPPLPDEPVARSLHRARRTAVLAIALASVMAIVAGAVWAAGRDDRKSHVVIQQGTTSAPTTTRPTSTTVAVPPAAKVLPAGTAFIGLDRFTGDVSALDDTGNTKRVLFNAGVETVHHWPTIYELQLTPDGRTLWYASNPTGKAPCSAITERDLATGTTRVRFQGGSWMALSPDGTRLAYTGCSGRDPTVYIVDVGTGVTWPAPAPVSRQPVTPVGYLAWTPDGRHVLAEWQGDAAPFSVAVLTPTTQPSTLAWSAPVITLLQEDQLATTPDALYVSAGSGNNTWSIDRYDWTYHRVSSTPTHLGSLEITVHGGRVYAVGGPFTGGSGYDTSLYRLESNGQLTQLRHGIGDFVAVPASAVTAATAPTTTTTTLPKAPLTTNCATAQMRLALASELQSVMQQPAAFFSLTNTSATSCTLDGYPTLALDDAAGRPIPLAVSNEGAYQLNDPGPRVVTVPPGQTVYFGFGWVDVLQPNGTTNGCVYAARAYARLPGHSASLTAEARLADLICGGRGTVTAIAPRSAFTVGRP